MTVQVKTLVFLGGLGFDSAIFAQLKSCFSEYRIVPLSLPSAACPAGSVLEKLNCIATILGASIPPESLLLGWSLGGLMTMYLAYLFPDKISKVITIASAPKFQADDHWFGIQQALLSDFLSLAKTDMAKLLLRFSVLVLYPNKDFKLRKKIQACLKNPAENRESFLFYLNLLIDADLRTIYPLIRVPMLHLFGGNDAILPREIISCFSCSNFNSKISVIEGAGHIPFVTHQIEVVHRIKEFFK